MSGRNVSGASAQNPYRPFSQKERLDALVHDIVDVMMKLHAEKPNSGQDHPIEDFHGDNRVQTDCIQHFRTFERRVSDLETRLHEFERVVRQLGSSSGLIGATHRVRKHLLRIFEVFRADSASIYSTFGESTHGEVPDILRPHLRPSLGHMTQFRREFPDLFKELSEDLDEFLDSLLDIPEFSDKRLPESIRAFQGWLVYRADGLEDFREHLQTPAVKLYTHGLMDEMGEYLENTEDALESFAENGGVNAIKSAQERSQVQLQNMSTVATFFSAVSATTFQYTTDENDSTLDQVVRTLWISSLILSIASAINSQLAMHWRAAMYRSPRSALPMWMSLCLNHTPLLFLVFSVLTFSIGLVGYTYSSSQGRLVTTSATVLTSITSLILLLVVCWEARERWRASRSSRMAEGDDAGGLRNHRKWKARRINGNILSRLRRPVVKGIRHFYLAVCLAFSRLAFNPSSARRTEAAEDLESKKSSNESLVSIPASDAVQIPAASADGSRQASQEAEVSPQIGNDSEGKQPRLRIETSLAPHHAANNQPLSPSGASGLLLMMGRPFYNKAWQLVRNPESRKHLNTLPMSPYGQEHLQSLMLTVSLTPLKGRGSVRDLRFSPNGKWLGASFKDGTVGVWKVACDSFLWHASLAARPGSIVWSPDSQSLLVKADGGLIIWQPGAEPQFRRCEKGFEAFTWMSDSQDFAAASGNSVWIMAKETGAVKSHHSIHPSPLRIHDMASVTGGGGRKEGLLIIVCSVEEEPWSQELHEGFISLFGPRWQRVRPKNVELQRRIIVYDIKRREVAAAVPVRGEAQQVTVSRNGKFALISYGPSTPPELWHIERSKKGEVFLELCHMYLHTAGPGGGDGPTDFVGQARFGGDCDEYVVAVTKNGAVYIWDCLSSHLSHSVKDIRRVGALREAIAIAWCPTNDERKVPLFACGIDDGTLVVWQGSNTEPCPGFPAHPISSEIPDNGVRERGITTQR